MLNNGVCGAFGPLFFFNRSASPPPTPQRKKKTHQPPPNKNNQNTDCAEGYGLAPFAYSAKTQRESSHAPKPKLMVCAPCPLGTFSDGGAYSTTLCERCPTGSTTPTPVSTSDEECTLCQSGFAGTPPDVPCKLCPAGTFADPDDNAVCTDCPEGFTTPKAGMTTEDACYIAVCDVNQQSIKGECYDCADGYVADKVRRRVVMNFFFFFSGVGGKTRRGGNNPQKKPQLTLAPKQTHQTHNNQQNTNKQGNALFGKYQPKCVKVPKPYNNKDVHLARGKAYEGADGYLAEPKEHDKEFEAPKASTKDPKMKSLAINAKAGGKHDSAPVDGL